ncbi:uncharacterized protein LOC125843082 [Solanum stenotomum]|uniref:uncharacterized protein LOC125843082 n=1 Tax=Solanum stenotomum TaxID=172797 RepID=UPI0020D05A57|nr:uncharacterized protein LOC125843082 [Solanum stenotomum]
MEIRYAVKGNSCPLCIRNDMGVKLYIEVKKHEIEFGMYPLCIDTSNRSDEDIHNFDATTGAIVCVEGGKRDTKALSIVESKICDSYYISEMEVENYILDTNASNVEVKQLYKDKTTLMVVMEKYKIKHSFNFRVKRSDSKSYVLVCHLNACCWELKASVRKNTDIFKVRYFNSEHTYPLRDRVLSKVQATVGFLSDVTAPKLVNHKRKHTPSYIIEDVRALYGVQISYQQEWSAKELALEMIRGKPADGYKQMPKYIYMLNTVYPNSYIRMHKSEKNEFMYLFISLRPMMRGFEFCRPVVVIDASHLSGSYRRTFISASALDGEAYEIVDMENDCSWTWFFQHFKNVFGDREQMCVVSYRNESILKSVSIVYPNVPHFACIWHL